MPYMQVNHEVDPKQKILEDLGDISGIEISDNNVLLAVYQRPTTMKLGGKIFHVADRVVDEDKYQSKVGLIIKHGPTCFIDPTGQWFNGVDYALHDWVVVPASAVYSMQVNGVLCRLVSDTSLKMKVPDCDMVY